MKRIYEFSLVLLLLMTSSAACAGDADKNGDDTSGTPRIIGGQETQPGAYPWMAALVDADQDTNLAQFCSGTLIHPRWVLTAAHCVKQRCSAIDEDAEVLDVVLGIHDLENDAKIGKRIKVRRIVSHPSYNDYSHNYDIALLELAQEVSYETLPLVEKNAELDGKEAMIIGWGSIEACRYQQSATLQQVTLPVISNYECNKAYNTICNPFLYKYPITEHMMCAGYGDGVKDSCYGDSGGPLMIRADGIWKLAGVVSWGEGCAQPGLYGVYARISKFVDFINETLNATVIFGKLTTTFAGHDALDVANAEIKIDESLLSFSSHIGSDEYGRFSVEIPRNRIDPDFTYTAAINAPGLMPMTKHFTLQPGQSVDLSTHIPTLPLGDFNGNGKTGLDDMIGILQIIAGMR
jgi:secreted trypsin-like serine protease